MVKILIYTIVFNAIFILSGFAQGSDGCRDFTQIDVELLNENDYIPDGRFNSVKLTYGDKIQVYKPFYKGKKYLIIVSCDELIEGISIELTDMTRKLIYKSDSAINKHKVEFVPDKNQNLIINVSVDKKDNQNTSVKACVSVVVGFKI